MFPASWSRRSLEKHRRGARPAAVALCRKGSPLMEHQLLYSQIGELTDKQGGFVATIDGIDCPEFLEQPSGAPESAQDRSVQSHLKDFTCDIDVVPRIGIGNIEDGIGSPGDTHRLRVAEV